MFYLGDKLRSFHLLIGDDQFQRFLDNGTAPGRDSLRVGNGAGTGNHVKIDASCDSTDLDRSRLQKIESAFLQDC